MAEGHFDGDTTSEGSAFEAMHRELKLSDRLRLWKWRFRNGGHRLPQYASKIPHFLDVDDAGRDLHAILHALSLKANFPKQAKTLAKNYVATKQKLDSLLQGKELGNVCNFIWRTEARHSKSLYAGRIFMQLEWHLKNTKKELLVRRSEATDVSKKILSLRKKIAQCKKTRERYQKEQNHLLQSSRRLEAVSSNLHKERGGIVQEYEEVGPLLGGKHSLTRKVGKNDAVLKPKFTGVFVKRLVCFSVARQT